MLPIYLCDDQAEHRERLGKMIENIIFFEGLDMELVLATKDPLLLLETIPVKSRPALYFLDVDLKHEIDGFGLATQIRRKDPRGFIVFITTHSEKAPLTFQYKVEAMDYIIKEETELISERLKACMKYAITQYTLPSNMVHKAIAMQVEDRIFTFSQNDIVMLEPSIQAHKITIHTIDSVIEISSTIKAIKTQLDERFFQCNKSCVINIDRIAQIEKKTRIIHMVNGKECYVSVRQIKALEKQLISKYGQGHLHK